jgi:GAF domain-containing protein
MLEQMSQRLRASHNIRAAVNTILADVIALHGAEFGNIQLVAGDVLLLVGQQGHGVEFVKSFNRVTKDDFSGCARAFRTGMPIVIPDIAQDAEFAPYVQTAETLAFRAVQSTPLIATGGDWIGVVSTQFASPHEPSDIEMNTVISYAIIAADYLKSKIGSDSLERVARLLYDDLLATA